MSFQHDLVRIEYNTLDQYDQGREENHWAHHQALYAR